jgi:hypothetical protein
MRLVERMNFAPHSCVVCGVGNTPDGDTGEVGPFIDLGVEVSWGDHAYMCLGCGTKVGVLCKMGSAEDMGLKDDEIRRLKRDNHELQSTIELATAREKAQLQSSRAA